MIRLVYLAVAALAAAPALAPAQPVEIRAVPVPPPGEPRSPRQMPDFASLDETGLRAVLADRRLMPDEHRAAIAELRRRYPSPSARAFALNAEARLHVDAFEATEALALYRRVGAEFGSNRDPAVEAEVARAMQGEIEALDLIEALLDTGPLRPLTAETVAVDSPSNRLRRALVERYRGRREPAIRAIVAQERRNLAVLETIASGRNSDPPRMMALVAEYSDSDDPAIQRVIADILFGLGFFAPDYRQAIVHWDELLRRFGQSADPELRSSVAAAYSNKSYALEQLGDHAQAARVQAEEDAWRARVTAGDPEN